MMVDKNRLLLCLTCLLLLALACARGQAPPEGAVPTEETQKEEDPPAEAFDPLGGWTVVDFTGAIEDERVGGGLEVLCDYYNTSYQPDLRSEDTYIQLLESQGTPDLGNIPPDLLGGMDVVGDEGGVFVFSIGFDNGYHSNRALEDLGVSAQFMQLLPGAWEMSYGIWTRDRINGFTELGSPGGGKSRFQLLGAFAGPNRMEGTWSFEETTALPGGEAPECNTAASGEGSWVAERQ